MVFLHKQTSALDAAVQQHDIAFNTRRLTLEQLADPACCHKGTREATLAGLHSSSRGAQLMRALQGAVVSFMASHGGAACKAAAIRAALVESMDAIDAQVGKSRDSMRFVGFCGVRLQVTLHAPLGGRSYFPLPAALASKKALINIQNSDNRCFLYSLVCGLLLAQTPAAARPRGHPERVSCYKDKLGLVRVPPCASIPPDYADFPKFEAENQLSLCVFRVCTSNPEAVTPFYQTSTPPVGADGCTSKRRPHINLLLMVDDTTGTQDGPWREHYVVITDLSRLLGSLVTKNEHRQHFCVRCLQRFPSERELLGHEQLRCWEVQGGVDGSTSGPRPRVSMPPPGSVCTFKRAEGAVRKPFVVYADFEAANVPVADGAVAGRGTQLLTRHQVTSYALLSVSAQGQPPKLVKHTAATPCALISHFMSTVMATAHNAQRQLLTTNVPLRMTPEQAASHAAATACYACGRAFDLSARGLCKVADHDHLTGEYRGAAHCDCNLRMRDDRYTLPVLFHNLKSYDAHHLLAGISEWAASQRGLSIDAIPLNAEKFISFTVKARFEGAPDGEAGLLKVQFLDSCQFLPSSLDTLVKSLKGQGAPQGDGVASACKFPLLGQCVDALRAPTAPGVPASMLLELLTRKGVFPYDWFSSLDKLASSCLPSQADFHSILTGQAITDADYAHAQQVWGAFGCQTFQDYLELYMQTDVLLLADVFESFRTFSLTNLGLDPCRYVTLPGLGFDAMLKMTGARLELLSEEDMHVFVERGIRGGVSMISHRAARANNPYLPDGTHDPSQPSSYILYLDANSLYPWAMQQPLPTGGFRWLDPDRQVGGVEGVLDLLASTPDDGPVGYFFEVDLAYPAHLHDAHNDLPFCPERALVGEDMVSPYNKGLLAKFGVALAPETKLVPSLRSKSGYVIHHRALKQALAHGLQLQRVTRCLRFDQAPWMKPYIDFCVAQRQAASSDFERDLFKLMMNSKTMENVRKRTDLRIYAAAQRPKLLRKLAHPFLRSLTVLSPHLVAVQSHKTDVRLDKPVYVGAAVLDVAKTLVYDFHYDVMQARYGHADCRLLFTDTDSLCYWVHTEDAYCDMAALKQRLDLSAYPPSHPLHDPTNAKVAGKFKDECSGRTIVQFVGLRPKLYAYRSVPVALPGAAAGAAGASSSAEGAGGRVTKRAKGVARAALNSASITLADYASVLAAGERRRVEVHAIRSFSHSLHTIRQHRVALSALDTKRWVCADGVHTLAHGHYAAS